MTDPRDLARAPVRAVPPPSPDEAPVVMNAAPPPPPRRPQWSARGPIWLGLGALVVLVLGFGRIGTRVARLCAAFGMRVAVHDPFVPAGTIRHLLLRGIGAAMLTRTLVADDLASGRLIEVQVSDLPVLYRDSAVVQLARGGRLPRAAAGPPD